LYRPPQDADSRFIDLMIRSADRQTRRILSRAEPAGAEDDRRIRLWEAAA
jgi:hypothetical protein